MSKPKAGKRTWSLLCKCKNWPWKIIWRVDQSMCSQNCIQEMCQLKKKSYLFIFCFSVLSALLFVSFQFSQRLWCLAFLGSLPSAKVFYWRLRIVTTIREQVFQEVIKQASLSLFEFGYSGQCFNAWSPTETETK